MVLALVYLKDKEGQLRSLDATTSRAIVQAAASGQRLLTRKSGVYRKEPATFDTVRMKRVREPSSQEYEEDILIEIPWNGKKLKAAESYLPTSKVGLRSQIVKEALDRIMAESFLLKALAKQQVPVQSFKRNPYLHLLTDYTPYKNFLANLAAVTQDPLKEELYDLLLGLATTGPSLKKLQALEQKNLFLVFHGTNQAFMDSILQTGLLPSFRRSSAYEWFGRRYMVSLGYTQSKTMTANMFLGVMNNMVGLNQGFPFNKVLYFWVLNPNNVAPDHITSDCIYNQLPLGEISLNLNNPLSGLYG